MKDFRFNHTFEVCPESSQSRLSLLHCLPRNVCTLLQICHSLPEHQFLEIPSQQCKRFFLQEVIHDKPGGSPPHSAEAEPRRGMADAAEGFVRHTKVIDFLNFHKTVPLGKSARLRGGEICGPSRRFGLPADEPKECNRGG